MLLVFIVFLILLFLGVPVAVSCGLAGIVYFLNNSNMIFNQVIQQTFSSVQSPSLLAIPMFIFAGNLMNASGITHRLLGFCGMLTRRMYGGMAQTSVLMSTFMGGISGSSVADAAMESRILGPNMLKHGYSRGYTGVVIGFTSLITSTIPPGNNLILYGTSGEVSIGKLFTAGLSSGLLMMVFLLITVSITSHRKGYMPHSDLAPTLPEILAGIVSNFWALLFPIILLVGIRLGWFTASEVGAFACVYALFCGFIAYRELGIKQLGLVLRDSVVDIAAIVFLIALTGPFGYGIAIDHIPQTLTAWMTGITTNPFVVQLIVVIVLLIMGCFMEGGAVILILTPHTAAHGGKRWRRPRILRYRNGHHLRYWHTYAAGGPGDVYRNQHTGNSAERMGEGKRTLLPGSMPVYGTDTGCSGSYHVAAQADIWFLKHTDTNYPFGGKIYDKSIQHRYKNKSADR